MAQTNPVLQRALEHPVTAFRQEEGLDRIVAFGDTSHRCPVYVERTPPCQNSCPAGEDIRGMHNILRGIEGKGTTDKWAEAFYRLTAINPFPFVMGQVCPAPCQGGCNRQYLDETVSINAVEHSIGKYGIDNKLAYPKPEKTIDKKIAVVGSGPAGLSAAYQLARRGYQVTIFESATRLGGMMRYGTLGYRVSREALEAEITRIVDLGIEIKTGVKIGVDMTLDQLRTDFDAVFIGVGAQNGRRLPLPGAEGTGVTDTIAFLKEFEDNGKAAIGDNVAVLGDGDVAMDAARLALRLGKKVTIYSGVAREDMNCKSFEFDEAMAEGAGIKYQYGAAEIVRENGKVTGARYTMMVKKEKGEEGWNSPIPFLRYKPVAGSDVVDLVDTVIFSIGQGTDMTGLEAACNGKPFLNVTGNFQVVGMGNVFGGGDAVKIELITTAVGHGRKAAEAIDRYLNDLPQPRVDRPDIVKYEKLKSDFFTQSGTTTRSQRHVDHVVGDFDTMLESLTTDQTVAESERCMSCGLCFECDQCKIYCPQEAIVKFRNNPPGEVMFTHYERCVGCHICSEICPTGYIDMGMGE
jgi:NADPH-dependent glutamate synthase beta subunit-like oxidoreductase/Pyruvate/2-oxoacid:ferredoxin oxidoreductase delta subunit